jgi:hypothetical protein
MSEGETMSDMPKRASEVVVERATDAMEKMHTFVIEKIDGMIAMLNNLRNHKIASFEAAKAALAEDAARADKSGEVCAIVEEWVNGDHVKSLSPEVADKLIAATRDALNGGSDGRALRQE